MAGKGGALKKGAAGKTPSVGILMACHGAASQTEKAVLALWEYLPKGWAPDSHRYIVEDRCPEESGKSAMRAWPGEKTLIETEKEHFWARSMALAEEAAMARVEKTEGNWGTHDYLLWMNQDTTPTAPLDKLFERERIIAATCLIDGIPSKGALVEDGARCRFRIAKENETPTTFNGNLVAIPQKIYKALRVRKYSHGFADWAYGLEARRKGSEIGRGPVCATTAAQTNNWRDEPTLWKRWKAAMRPTGLPPEDWWDFCIEFGGLQGPARFAWAYRHIFLKRKVPKPMVKPEI